ncbi:hypothetical protein LINGRAHAP2_LOCUS9267 [Linum grandiflorum]
MLRELAEE